MIVAGALLGLHFKNVGVVLKFPEAENLVNNTNILSGILNQFNIPFKTTIIEAGIKLSNEDETQHVIILNQDLLSPNLLNSILQNQNNLSVILLSKTGIPNKVVKNLFNNLCKPLIGLKEPVALNTYAKSELFLPSENLRELIYRYSNEIDINSIINIANYIPTLIRIVNSLFEN